jgi:hypothetical protein
MAMILLAMLSILTKLTKIKIKKIEAQRFRSRVISDYALDKALVALYRLVTHRIKLLYTDGQLLFYFPVVCGWLVDHQEHITL